MTDGARLAPVTTTDRLGRTPLHLAARFGRVEAARALASSDRDIGAADRYGATPLHVAAQHGHDSVVTALVGAGAPTDVEQLADDDGVVTLLHDVRLFDGRPTFGRWRRVHRAGRRRRER